MSKFKSLESIIKNFNIFAEGYLKGTNTRSIIKAISAHI